MFVLWKEPEGDQPSGSRDLVIYRQLKCEQAHGILTEEFKKKSSFDLDGIKLMTPAEIKTFLDEYGGQDQPRNSRPCTTTTSA